MFPSPLASKDQTESATVATKLSWPRTYLLVGEQRGIPVSQGADGALLNLPFCHLTSLEFLSFAGCTQSTITTEAFRHLTSLQSLDMWACMQSTITDDAFCHLTNLQSLNVRWCIQTTITNEAFRH